MRIGLIALFWACASGFPLLLVASQPDSPVSAGTHVEKQTTTITANGNELTVPDGNE